MNTAETLAQAFHETYERLAPQFEYETREASAKPWDEVPQQNRALMVATIKPRVIVEIGCDRGGTLYAWRQICPRVYGITGVDNSQAAGGSGKPLDAHGATVRVGDSHDPAAWDWLVCRIQADGAPLGQPVDVLVIDGDHSYDGVRDDFERYAPLVRRGGLVLLHDIAVVDDPRAEVHRLWPELAGRFRTSEIRSSRPPTYGWGVVHL